MSGPAGSGVVARPAAGNGLTLTGNTFAVNPDGATVEISANQVRVKDGGIGAAKLATGAVDLTTTAVTGALPITKGGTGQATVKTARETGLSAVGVYSVTGPASSSPTISVPQATHGLRASRSALHVRCYESASGQEVWPDVSITSGGDVTVTFGAAQATNAIDVCVQG